MDDQGLSSCVLQSDRTGNSFMAMLLFHHFLNHDDLIWLITFEPHNLAGDELKAMISAREVGAINNTTFRSLNRECDTLSASKYLRRLVDFWLLDKKGRGSRTYYVPSAKATENWPASVQASGKSTELQQRVQGAWPQIRQIIPSSAGCRHPQGTASFCGGTRFHPSQNAKTHSDGVSADRSGPGKDYSIQTPKTHGSQSGL